MSTSVAERAPAATTPAPAPPPLVLRLRVVTAALALVALAFSQAPGRLIGDTKSDLVLDPGGFLRRALAAWDPAQAFGQLANQSYGYLWPMGPFFWAGHAAGLPGWVVQRGWWALLLVTGFLGALRLAAALRIGTPSTRLVAALAYALSPRVLSVLGTISVEAWPAAVLPWVLLPLVRGAEGRLTPRQAAARSGVAVLCLGGVNAAATAAVLPLPVLYLLTRPRGVRGRLAGWWLAATALACAWWALPLLLLGRYGYPFLDLIETARVTTSVTGLTDVLRGDAHWLGYLVVHDAPAWTAGWRLATSGPLVLATALLAAAGLAGLLLPRQPERRWLLAGVLLGAALVTAGHVGDLTGPFAPAIRDALDGPLAPLRNVHKADPLLRLPLALGLAHLLATRLRWPTGAAATGIAAALLAATLSPAWSGGLAPTGAYDSTPGYWQDAAGWLAAHSDGRRTLVLPSVNAPVYLWGTPRDEPLQALARAPWAVRDAVPLGAPGATRLLDGLDARLATGQPSAAYAPVLARAGLKYVLLRNDLDPDRSGAERSGVVRAALAGSPGLRRVATFGPALRLGYRSGDRLAGAGQAKVRAIEVFEVAGAADRVVAYPQAGAVGLAGGPEGTLALADAGLLAGRAVVGVPDEVREAPVDAVVGTDTLRRRELNAGADPGRRYSATLAAGDPVPRPDIGPYPEGQSVAVLDGAAAVTASSRADDPFSSGYAGPQRRPAAAVDGDPATAWVSAGRPVGQWLELRLPAPAAPASVTVTVLADPSLGPAVTGLAVTTDAGRVDVPVTGARPVRVPLPAGTTTRVRVTVTAVDGRDGGAVGIRELAVPGVRVTQAVALPPVATAGPWAVVASRPDGRRGECLRTTGGWTCVPGLAEPGEETGPLERRFDAPAGPVTVAATVRPRRGAGLDALLDAAAGYRATGSSRLGADPAERPGAAYDGNQETTWIPAASDPAPQLSLDLGSRVTLTRVTLSGSFPGAGRVVLATPDGQRRTLAARNGAAQRIRPLRTDRVTLTFQRRVDDDGEVGAVELRDVALTGAPARRVGPVEVGCAAGPAVSLDGTVRRLALRAAADDLLTLAPVPATVCAGPVPVAAGAHRLSSTATRALEVAGVTLTGGAIPAAGAGRAVAVTGWSAEHRTVRVEGGPAAYLTLAESANPGWTATAGGRALTPVRLDGWRQAWLLPAGGPADVELTYGPGRTQRTVLLLGLLAALAVLAAALLPPRTRPATPPVPAAAAGRAPGSAGSRRPLAGRAPGRARGPGARRVLAGTGVGLVGVLLTGPAGVVPAAAALVLPRRWWSAGAGGALALAGVLRAAVPGAGWAPGTHQLLAAAALCVAAAALTGWRPPGEPVGQAQRRPLDQVPGQRAGADRERPGQQRDGQHPPGEVGPAGQAVDRVEHEQVPEEDAVGDPAEEPHRR